MVWLKAGTDSSWNAYDTEHNSNYLLENVDLQNRAALPNYHFEFLHTDADCNVPYNYIFTIFELGQQTLTAQSSIMGPVKLVAAQA